MAAPFCQELGRRRVARDHHLLARPSDHTLHNQDYPNDVEVTQKMKIWKSKAEQSCLRAVKAHQERG